jgi:hypothetical protein
MDAVTKTDGRKDIYFYHRTPGAYRINPIMMQQAGDDVVIRIPRRYSGRTLSGIASHYPLFVI